MAEKMMILKTELDRMDLAFVIWVAGGILIPCFSFFFCFGFIICTKPSHVKRRRLPGPTPWPIIGNLHMLGPLPHQKLAQLAHRYGPIFFLRLGSIPTVVVSSPAIAKEVLHTHDKILAYRPCMLGAHRLLYPGNLLFMQYGHQCRYLRKLCTMQLFTSKRLHETRHVRMEELLGMFHAMESQSKGGQLPLNLSSCLGCFTANVILRLAISIKASESNMRGFVHEMSKAFGMVVIGDFIPWLGWLDFYVKWRMDDIRKKLDCFMEKVLTERTAAATQELPRKDMLDAFLRLEKEGEMKREDVKAVLVDLITAGIETTSDTIEWVLAELLRNPKALTKLRDELDSLNKPFIEESDLPNLTYMQAVIKETFRLHPVTPLLLPHMAREACKVGGYEVGEKATVMVNVWAIGRSREVWGENCEEFHPERFMNSKGDDSTGVDVRGQHFQLLPFGAGRRMCVGMPLALRSIELLVSNVVRCFHLELAGDKEPSDLDMRERPAFNSSLAHPLIVIPKLRMPHLPSPY